MLCVGFTFHLWMSTNILCFPIIDAPGPMNSMNAVRMCEHRFDLYEVERRRAQLTINPYEAFAPWHQLNILLDIRIAELLHFITTKILKPKVQFVKKLIIRNAKYCHFNGIVNNMIWMMILLSQAPTHTPSVSRWGCEGYFPFHEHLVVRSEQPFN